jgi:2-amino-4-hydroxy-6-hydroxymethyldihydropteridine diphosphokinase
VTVAYVGLGSNLGDRMANLRQAVALLDGRDGAVRVLRTSPVYETDPVGGPPQPAFLNAVAEVDVTGTARTLLETCMAVESGMGRTREERWGPRVIDLDVLLFGFERIDEPDLVVPHPRMAERSFVLVPLADLDRSLAGEVGRGDGGARQAGGVRLYSPRLDTNS